LLLLLLSAEGGRVSVLVSEAGWQIARPHHARATVLLLAAKLLTPQRLLAKSSAELLLARELLASQARLSAIGLISELVNSAIALLAGPLLAASEILLSQVLPTKRAGELLLT